MGCLPTDRNYGCTGAMARRSATVRLIPDLGCLLSL
jgi:hypothetical protein